VTFENVSFSYKGRQGTLRNVSFSCKGGDRVAVVGPTGAGKTTLMNLLVRFYDPSEGSIKVDGYDIKDVTLDCLREQMSLVMQVPLLFSGTITDNIRYGKLTATMDDIVAAARAANCHEFISSLPNGYETELGEGGAQLSGGERQRIAVARAFIRQSPILIMDEPTSAIDSKTEAVILDALENLMEGRTSFMIAHRLSTVRTADLILVMNHGEVVEHGSHDELLAKGGLYYQLYEAQTGRAAAIEAQYAQDALAAGDTKLGVSDILAEVATAEALARYEQTNPHAPAGEPGAGQPGNGAEPPAGTDGAPGLRAPLVPQPGQPPVGEPVIETLTDAVRQHMRRAQSGSTSGGTAAERREHGKVDTGDTVPDDGGTGSNSAGDTDGPGSDSPGSSPFSAGNDAGV
jgi:ABC-type multidrug transport system ATPase subunit